MTDASHITLLPKILAHVRAVAPGIRLEVGPIAADTGRALEVGDADLALGFIPGLESGFHKRMLYEQDFVCLVSARHPRIGKVFTSRAYQEEAHVGILSGTLYTIVDAALKSHRCQRRVLLIDEPSIGLSPKLVQEVMTMLRGLADAGTTILMVEQNVRTALKYANRALVLEMGRLALDRPAGELLDDPNLNRLFLGGGIGRAAGAARV